MAPFRGRGGRARGNNRGGGYSRGGAHRSRGRGRGRGAGTAPNDKLARSGIRTRAGYRKFDSQRIKEVDQSESEDEVSNGAEEVEPEDVDLSEDDEVEITPRIKAYNALMQTFQQPVEENRRKRKRRKLDRKEEAEDEVIEITAEEAESVDGDVDEAPDEDDQVDMAEVDGSTAEDVDVEDTSDPFEVHFANPDDNDLSRRLKAIQNKEWRPEKQATSAMATLTVSAPKCIESITLGKSPITAPSNLNLKRRLQVSATKHISSFSPLQQTLASYMFNYSDILLGNRTPTNASEVRQLTCLHALNHILKGRDKVLKNNARLAHNTSNNIDADLDFRDQGFTRPKVLILTETRQMCAKYAHSLVSLFEPEQEENKQRFTNSFESPPNSKNAHMPEDYQELFQGNNDNNFVTAMKLTRKTMKFFSPFYTSDIILASPLGLRRILEDEDAKKRDHDFLSSIEIVVVDQADAVQMQNWTNVESVFDHLNLQLKEAHGCDFSRVRSWYLDGHAKHLRQTLVFAAYITPEMNRLFNTHMLNVAGKIKLQPTHTHGAIASVSNILGTSGIKQIFSRFSSPSPAADPDARFKYFITAVLPSLLRLPQPPAPHGQGILIFIPSYYDFLRLRNYFATSTQTQNLSFGTLHEYTSVSDQRRARAHFLSGRHSFLLYTQRAHHFFRLRLKGVKRVVLYGVPDNSTFYEEVVGGFLGAGLDEGEVGVGSRCLFSRWEGLGLERVVGGSRVEGMLGGGGDTFEFV